MLAVGGEAPGFRLDGVDGRTGERGAWQLSQFRGRTVVLVFYPADDSPVCTQQLLEYTKGIGEFDRLGAQVLAISPQSAESHAKFAGRHGGFAFPLLTDADKAVGGAYGILGLLGFYRRSVFVVDPEGVLRYVHRAVAGLSFRPTAELVRAATAASAPS